MLASEFTLCSWWLNHNTYIKTMMVDWQDVFSKDGLSWQDGPNLANPPALRDLEELRRFLDAVHIRYCLAKPYQEDPSYPVVEGRELLPSFESDIVEYRNLPGFSLVAFARPLDYFSEIFQFDKLHSHKGEMGEDFCLLRDHVFASNINTLASRLPRAARPKFSQEFAATDVSGLAAYPALLPYLLQMDRAQVLSWDNEHNFHLSGVFASFPSDIDSELKRFGLRIGKFVNGDSTTYERNRLFVYQSLMELYGFPIVSERRTSSALFARKLHKMGEKFLLRVLGQTDRTLTTYISDGSHSRYPKVEKIALVRVDGDQKEALEMIGREGYFLDRQKRVIIMRITYRQHRFDPGNLRQDRALSVASQEILHPLTGESLGGLNIIRDASNMFLRLNDIVRGEYAGRIVYKRTELVENTDTDEKRLKFLYSWLTKHQRRMITYTDDYFSNVDKVVEGYLQSPKKSAVFETLRDLHQEVCERLSYIRQARKVRALEELSSRLLPGIRTSYRQMTVEAVEITSNLQFELVDFFPDLVQSIIKCIETILQDRYLVRTYIDTPDKKLTRQGQEIRRNYGRLVSMLDQIRSVARVHEATKKAEASVA